MQTDQSNFPVLSPVEARVLGSLVEKKELTPDVYPMTLNALMAAANQKTARVPVMELDVGQVRQALSGLEKKALVRQVFASRVERYEHLMAQKFTLTRGQIALLGLMLLRGQQTAFELLARVERMAGYPGVEALRDDIDLMIGRRPPLVKLIERGPGQREDRYAHLLSGDVVAMQNTGRTAHVEPVRDDLVTALEHRVDELERQVAALTARLDDLGA